MPKLSVAVPGAPFVLTARAAERLADAWVSEHNRLRPAQESAPDPRDGNFFQPRGYPNGFFIADLWVRVSEALFRRGLRKGILRDLGIPSPLARRLRAAFDEEMGLISFEAHDAEIRAHLAEVLFNLAREDLD